LRLRPPLTKISYAAKGYGIFDVTITKGYKVPDGKPVEFHGSPEVCTPYFTLKGKVSIELTTACVKLKCCKGDSIGYYKTNPKELSYQNIVDIISELNIVSNNSKHRDELYALVAGESTCSIANFKTTRAYSELQIEYNSEYFRIDYEHPLRIAFGKQKEIRLLSVENLKKVSKILADTPWYLCFSKHTKEFDLKEVKKEGFLNYVRQYNKKVNPMISTAIRIFDYVKNQKKSGHDIFQKSTLFKNYFETNYQTAYTFSDDKYQKEAIDFLMYHAFITVSDDYIAIPKDVTYNRSIIRSLKRLKGKPSQRFVDVPCIPSKTLTKEQEQFIQHVYTNPISFLEGAPGTGKTEVLVALMAYFDKALVVTHVGMMVDSLQKRFGDRVETAHTICSVIAAFKYNSKAYKEWLCKYDMLIIDEGSNMDCGLLSDLLDSVPQITRLIIVGDSGQIFPIKSGCPFFDLLTCFPEHSFELTENKRVEIHSKNLADISTQIRNGLLPITFKDDDDSVRFYQRPDNEEEQFKMLCNLLMSFPLLKPLEFQIVTLTNECKNKLNKWIEELLIKTKYLKKPNVCIKLGTEFIYAGKKITFSKNVKPHPTGDYAGVKNGELAIVKSIVPINNKSAYILTLNENKKVLLSYIDDKAVNPLQISAGYATTSNKAQGSEWSHVLFWIHEKPSKFFTREFPYVAVSRSKRQCIIIAKDEKDFHNLCADKARPRNTLLKYYLQNENPGLLKDVELFEHIKLPTKFKLLSKNVAAVPVWIPDNDTTKKEKDGETNTNIFCEMEEDV